MNSTIAPLAAACTLPSGLTLPNRLALAPMTTWSGNADGTISEDELRYLARRCAGLGMAITAACYVSRDGYAFHRQWGCDHDGTLPSLRAAADTIHRAGARAVLQIHHGGRMCPASLLGHAPLSASAVPAARPDADMPREMTEDEILRTIDAYGQATRRAVEAGYDGVEIHGANTYLPQQFFSPHSNRRSDAWGGGLEARMRFPLAVVEAVRKAARDAAQPFAVGYRLSPEEVEEPGITLDDTVAFAGVLACLGLDWIHVSVRDYRAGSLRDRSDTRRPTRVLRDAIAGRTPVIGVGKVYHPEDAAFILDDGCDLVALGRILLMEPDWTRKMLAGEWDAIRTALPVEGGAELLDLPLPMYERLLAVKGWLPVK
jgi:2,4-dienoyl-CoA reductase-like NADH-dependent reductase (Old Yellow Enzyme family)